MLKLRGIVYLQKIEQSSEGAREYLLSTNSITRRLRGASMLQRDAREARGATVRPDSRLRGKEFKKGFALQGQEGQVTHDPKKKSSKPEHSPLGHARKVFQNLLDLWPTGTLRRCL